MARALYINKEWRPMQIKCEAIGEYEAQLRYKHPLCRTVVLQRGHYR